MLKFLAASRVSTLVLWVGLAGMVGTMLLPQNPPQTEPVAVEVALDANSYPFDAERIVAVHNDGDQLLLQLDDGSWVEVRSSRVETHLPR